IQDAVASLRRPVTRCRPVPWRLRSTGCEFRSCACVAKGAPWDGAPVSTAAVGALPANSDGNRSTSTPRHPCGTRRCLESGSPLTADSSAPVAPEAQVGVCVEDRVLPVMETSAPQFDGAQNLDALALSRDGDFRRVPDPTPGGMQRGVLSKTPALLL